MWTFMLVAALFSGGAVADSVRFDTMTECVSYAHGRLEKLEGVKLSAHCVSGRTGLIITF